jgi:hypothetical protein
MSQMIEIELSEDVFLAMQMGLFDMQTGRWSSKACSGNARRGGAR